MRKKPSANISSKAVKGYHQSSDIDHLFSEKQSKLHEANNMSGLKRRKRFSLMEQEPIKGLLANDLGTLHEENDAMLSKQLLFKEEMVEERKNMVQRLEKLRAQKMALLRQRNDEIRVTNQSTITQHINSHSTIFQD